MPEEATYNVYKRLTIHGVALKEQRERHTELLHQHSSSAQAQKRGKVNFPLNMLRLRRGSQQS